jgi:hypothetical protein
MSIPKPTISALIAAKFVGIPQIVRVIFVSGGCVVEFFLDAILGGSGGEAVGGADVGAWWREVSRVGAIAMGVG